MTFEELCLAYEHYRKWERNLPQGKQWQFSILEIEILEMKFSTYELSIPKELVELKEKLKIKAKYEV